MKLPLWRRRRREEEMEEELQSHLQMAIRDRMERGESAEEAELAARREFGNVGLIKETTREMWGLGMIETFWQDVRYGARMLLKQPHRRWRSRTAERLGRHCRLLSLAVYPSRFWTRLPAGGVPSRRFWGGRSEP